MRVTKASLTAQVRQAEDRVRHLQDSSVKAAQEIRDLRAMVDARMTANATLQSQAERDREALLTAENRVCELEAAIVSLAVRVA